MEQDLYIFLLNYCSLVPLKNILITSSGDKDNIVSCIIKGVQNNSNLPQNSCNIFYIESCKTKFDQIRNKYAFLECLNPINYSSINTQIVSDISDNQEYSLIKKHEMDYIIKNNIPQNGLDHILSIQPYFDLVIFNNNPVFTPYEFEKLNNLSDAYLFPRSFYNSKQVLNLLKNKDHKQYIKSQSIMFINNKIIIKYTYPKYR
jgi:hypothetical protein